MFKAELPYRKELTESLYTNINKDIEGHIKTISKQLENDNSRQLQMSRQQQKSRGIKIGD